MQFRLATVLLAATLSPALATGQVYQTVHNSTVDPVLSPASSKFLTLPGIFTDLVRSGGGQFVELPNGDARLTGRVFAQSNLYVAFLFDITLTGRITPADPGYPPAGAPNLGLYGSAYTPGGSVDPNTFVYYTGATGTLTGVRNMLGGKITLASVGPVQLGTGANNRNGMPGMFGEFAVTVDSNPPWWNLVPAGNAEFSLDFVTPYNEDTTHPQVYVQSLTNLTDGRALSLPGVGDDYVFVPAADFQEQNNGQATLNGTLARVADLDDTWDISLALSGRVDPGEASYPPVGSPVQQMLPNAYVAGGGPLDPDSWHYYTTVTGTLTGTGLNAGGLINLTQTSATQVGGGANNTNTYFGTYGSFAASIASQPTGRTITITGDAEVFALTASFPVLPFPTLTTPSVTPTHPTVTDQGLILEGDNLAWVKLATVAGTIFNAGDATDFLGGWLRIIDNTHIEVHPVPGLVPGPYNVRVYNPAVQSNQIGVDLVAPTTPVFYSEPTVGEGDVIHGRMHHGNVVGPAAALVVLSQSLAPSSVPGIANLDIGANWTDYLLDPTIYFHDGASGVAEMNYGPISAALLGQSYYFQGLVVDIGTGTPPFSETNYWQVTFQ